MVLITEEEHEELEWNQADHSADHSRDLDHQVSFDLHTTLSASGSRCLWKLPVCAASKIYFKARLGETSCMVSRKLFAANVYWPEMMRKYR